MLGGIGPFATARFYEYVLRELIARDFIECNEDFPRITIESLNAPELVGEVTDEMLAPYENGIRRLADAGCALIAMPCNTIHLYRDRLQRLTKVPILDLVATVRERVLGTRGSVLLIGTSNTLREDLYRVSGNERFGLPTIGDQELLDRLIVRYNAGDEPNACVRETQLIVERYAREETFTCCTEFSLMLDTELSSLRLMAEATIDALIRSA